MIRIYQQNLLFLVLTDCVDKLVMLPKTVSFCRGGASVPSRNSSLILYRGINLTDWVRSTQVDELTMIAENKVGDFL